MTTTDEKPLLDRHPCYRVWCIAHNMEEPEEHGKSYFDKPYAKSLGWPGEWTCDADDAARRYAEYFYNECDGHRDRWPIRFRVRSPDGTTTDFDVECEYEPSFSATAVEAPATAAEAPELVP